MKEYSKRLSRPDKQNLSAFRLTDRDYQILIAVYKYRLLTSVQVRRLIFPNLKSVNRTNIRLKKLYHHGYLDRIEQPTRNSGLMNMPLIYVLDELGAKLIRDREGLSKLDWKSTNNDIGLLFLEHMKLVNDFRIGIELASKKHGYQILKHITEAELKRLHEYPLSYTDENGKQKKSRLIPDGYYLIEDDNGDVVNYFVEIDRATETVRSEKSYRSFTTKILLYRAFLESGEFTKMYGAPNFRVLVVTIGDTRVENLIWSTEQIENADFFCFTTLNYLNQSNIFEDKIWGIANEEELFSLID